MILHCLHRHRLHKMDKCLQDELIGKERCGKNTDWKKKELLLSDLI